MSLALEASRSVHLAYLLKASPRDPRAPVVGERLSKHSTLIPSSLLDNAHCSSSKALNRRAVVQMDNTPSSNLNTVRVLDTSIFSKFVRLDLSEEGSVSLPSHRKSSTLTSEDHNALLYVRHR